MYQNIDKMFKRVTDPIYYWSQDNFGRILLFLFLLYVVGFPLLELLQGLARKIPSALLNLFGKIIPILVKNISITDTVLLLFIGITGVLLIKVIKRINEANVIKDYFKKSLAKWILPKNSIWKRLKGGQVESPGYILNVTNSHFPGLLKESFGWYDYEACFEARIDGNSTNPNIGFVVRAADHKNAVFLQLKTDEFVPHLLNNGTYFIDDSNKKQLEININKDHWYKIKVSVSGETIDVDIEGLKIRYEIPAYELKVDGSELRKTLILSNIKNRDVEIRKDIQQVVDKLNQMDQTKDEIEKDRLRKDAEEIFESKLQKFETITFDYSRGSFGFRESQKESTYFKNLQVKKTN